MGLSNHNRFESHMDVSSPETIGDAEMMTDVEERGPSPYDDMFNEKIDLAEQNYSEKISDSDYEIPEKSTSPEKSEPSSNKPDAPNTPHLSDGESMERAGDIAFESTVDANPQFGEGGGRQIFVRDFGKMVDDGRLKHIKDEDEILIISPDIDNSVVVTAKSSNGDYSYSIDERASNENEIEQLNLNTSPKQRNVESLQLEQEELRIPGKTVTIQGSQGTHEMTYTVEIGELTDEGQEEWDELDQNTIDDQGLTRVMKNKGTQQEEDWRYPLSDQEGSKGVFHPDGWERSRKLEPGEIFYQIRPLNPEHSSSYVTDKMTIDECRNKDGSIDVEKLFGKLQILPVKNTTYTLRAYEYSETICTKSNAL